MDRMKTPTDRPYHHGDLRRAVIETASAMLREDNNWQFTLREVARRAGVSHGAPYKHFPDKESLLAELARQGFEQLQEALAASTARSRSIRKELLAAGTANVRFGVGNPALYRLMFGSGTGSRTAGVHLRERTLPTRGFLVDILRRGQEAGVFKKHALQGQAAACWAQVHGLTLLSIDGLLMAEKVGADPVEAALVHLLEGLELAGPAKR